MTTYRPSRVFALATFCFALSVAQSPTIIAAPLSFTVLHYFSSSSSDGYNPQSAVTWNGTKLFGTTRSGGGENKGTVYGINIDGSGFTLIHEFSPTPDGNLPWGGVTINNSTIYGTTLTGGTANKGSIFSVGIGGAGYTQLRSFPSSGADGNFSQTGLEFDGVKLYGAAQAAGGSGMGTLYSIKPDGTGFTVIHTFTGTDGEFPATDLTLVGSTLYGTTPTDSVTGKGTVFKVNTDGTGFLVLHRFTGADGHEPDGKLTVVGTQVFGTTYEDGPAGGGTVFKVNTNGTGFATLHSFSSAGSYGSAAGLTLVGSQLFGTTTLSPVGDKGTIYSMSTTGAGFTTVHNFTGPDGDRPQSGLLLLGSTLYGTAPSGGTQNGGVLFALTVPEPASFALATIALAALILTSIRRRRSFAGTVRSDRIAH